MTAGTFEGGIRTPALLKGGYIEKILQENTALTNNMCEYNNIVHLSDWYHIIMDITGITTNYSPDADHSSLGIWNNINCHCKGKVAPNTCDTTGNLRKPRDEIITMRMCGNKDGTYNSDQTTFNEANEFFLYSAYVRKGDYKLVVKYTPIINL